VGEISIKAYADARGRERERLSRILHDEITGGLTAAGLTLDLLALDVPPELTQRVREIQAMLEHSFDSVRDLSAEFHPDPAERFRLVPALEALARRFRKRWHGTLSTRLSDMANELNSGQARACYVTTESALDNIARHAGAGTASVALDCTGDNRFRLLIEDNGKGFEESTVSHGTGIAVMEYYVLVAGLKLSIQSEVGRGTRVQVSPVTIVPTKRGSHEDGD
jgi:signal transduction histidine kinase